jgi:predicted amidohydrolase YtcJ
VSPICDTVYLGGTVHTMDPATPRASMVGVLGTDIAFVGEDVDAEDHVGPSTRVIDLGGKMLLPGFHDTHAHPITASVFVSECNLYGLYTKSEMLAALADWVKTDRTSAWVRGSGWRVPPDQAEQLFRHDLDAIEPDRPMFLGCMDGHHAVANSKALALAGIDETTEDPSFGEIHRDRSGKPTGLLIEHAVHLVAEIVPDFDHDTNKEVLRHAMSIANSYGIVAMADAWTDPPAERAYRSLWEEGALTARINMCYPLVLDQELGDYTSRRLEGDEMLRGRWIKVMADGVMESLTAYVKDGYTNTPHENHGLAAFTDQQLWERMPALEAAGFQFHSHAIGDAAVAQILTALEVCRERNGGPNNRPIIAHNYLIDPVDYRRIRDAGATLNFTMLWRQRDDTLEGIVHRHLDEARFERLMPLAEADAEGIVVHGGSDFYVSQIDPLASIAQAVTGKAVPYFRHLPYEPESQPLMSGRRPDLDTMLRAYTINGAFAYGVENLTGSIEVGKRADLIVLEHDLFDIPPERIYGTEVLQTMLNGEVVYEKDGGAG